MEEYMVLKRAALLTAATLTVMAGMTGCGSKQEEPVPEPIVEEIPQEEPEVEEEPVEEEPTTAYPVIEGREEVNGQTQSYLTGQWTDKSQSLRRPIAVMIPNNAPAMPQYGLSRAGIIYEAPVEGRITRLMAVVENFDDLDRIGPVRSSRD